MRERENQERHPEVLGMRSSFQGMGRGGNTRGGPRAYSGGALGGAFGGMRGQRGGSRGGGRDAGARGFGGGLF